MRDPAPVPIATRRNVSSRVIRSLASSVIGLVALGALAWVLFERRAELLGALDVDFWKLVLLAVLVLAAQAQRAIEFQFMLNRLGVKERFWDSFSMTGAALLLNHLPFSAGSVARAVFLRQRHALAYPAYVSALMVATLVSGGVSSACGLVASLAASPPSQRLAPLFLAVLLGACGALALVTFRMPAGGSAVHAALKRFEQASALLRSSRSMAALTATSCVRVVLSTARLAVCYHAFGESPSLPALVLLGSAGVLVSLVNLTPGNLGIRELALGAFSAALGGSAEHGMAAASLERAATLGCAVLVGVPGLVKLRRSAPAETSAD